MLRAGDWPRRQTEQSWMSPQSYERIKEGGYSKVRTVQPSPTGSWRCESGTWGCQWRANNYDRTCASLSCPTRTGFGLHPTLIIMYLPSDFKSGVLTAFTRASLTVKICRPSVQSTWTAVMPTHNCTDRNVPRTQLP